MKKILFIIGFLGALLTANAQIGQQPTSFKYGIRLPNATNEVATDSIPVIDGDGVIQGYITKPQLTGNFVHKDSVQYNVGISNTDPGKQFAPIVGIDVNGNPYWKSNGYQVTGTAASNSLPVRNGAGQIEVNAATDPDQAVNLGQLSDSIQGVDLQKATEAGATTTIPVTIDGINIGNGLIGADGEEIYINNSAETIHLLRGIGTGLLLRGQDSQNAGAQFDSRVEGSYAANNQDFVPLGQLQDTLATLESNIGANYIPLTQKGAANGVATLDGSMKIPMSQVPDALIGSVNYQGNWNPTTNTPTLPATPGSETKGHYYIVSTSGTWEGEEYNNGDWIISNGSEWDKVDNNNKVVSVNSLTGPVQLDPTFSNGQLGITGSSTVNLDSRYYTETELQTSGQAQVHWDNLTDVPSLTFTDEFSELSFGASSVKPTSLSATGIDGGRVIVDAGNSWSKPFTWGSLSTGWENAAGEGIEVMRRSSDTNYGGFQLFQEFAGGERPLKYKQKIGGDLTSWSPERTLWSDFNLPDPASNGDVVHLTGDETIAGTKLFSNPLTTTYTTPDADGAAGSGNSILGGLSRATNYASLSASGGPANNTVLTFKTSDARIFQFGTGTSSSNGFWYRPLHTTISNTWLRLWDSQNLTNPATETYVNNAIAGLRYFGTSATTGTQITLNNPIDLDTLSLSNAFVTTSHTNGPSEANNGIVTNYSYQSGSYFRTFMDYGNNRLWYRGNSLTALTNPWLEVAPKEWVNSQGFLTSPSTLQESTTAGNTTDTKISITGDSGANIDGLQMYLNDQLDEVFIEKRIGANVAGMLNIRNDNTTLLGGGVGVNSQLQLVPEIGGSSGQAGAVFNTRVQGAAAQKTTEYLNPANLGTGLTWNQNFFRVDWGETKTVGANEWITFPLNDGQVFSIGDPVDDGTDTAHMYLNKGATSGSFRFDTGTYGTSPNRKQGIFTMVASEAGETQWTLSAYSGTGLIKSVNAVAGQGIKVEDSRDGIGLIGAASFASNTDPLRYAQLGDVTAAVNPNASAWQNITLGGGATATTARCRKKGNVVEIQIEELIQTGTGTVVLPSGYRPTGITHFTSGYMAPVSAIQSTPIGIDTSGNLAVLNSDAKDQEVSLTYQFTIM